MQMQDSGKSVFANKWVQLAVGVVCMASVANLQYGWTLFVAPLDAKHHWGREAIQFAFTLFVLIETWLVPVEGYLVDRFGPRWVVLGGGALIGGAWMLNSVADSLALLYLGAVLGGIGTGCVYGTCVGNAIKWFQGRRGLAAGITAAGFGAGAALTIVPISNMIKSAGYEHAFMFFGMVQGAIVLVMAWGLMAAPQQSQDKARVAQSARDYAPKEVLRTPVFWVLYLMFVLIAAGGLMMAASLGPIAKDFKIDGVAVTLLGFTLPALTFAISLDRVFDGFGRPFFGWLSDRIGRESTMFLAFTIGAVALFLLGQIGSHPVAFVLLTATYFLVYGEIFSLFPATQGDTFGSKFAAANAGMLYTAKGTGALLVPIAAAVAHSRGWAAVFDVAMIFNAVAALLAVLVLKPMRARHMARTEALADKVVGVAANLGANNR
ncbi:MAG TPA: oxalate/formate MFS antiporter [Burkholderiales bacterium]|jgi:OFA family oxalate/formate antiporter-like MFS transporter